MSEFIPPVSTGPSSLSSYHTGAVIPVFTKKKWPIKMKYVEKGVIIENVDRWNKWAVAHGPS